MLEHICNAVVSTAGRVLPQVTNGIGNIERGIAKINSNLLAAKFKYFSGAADKADVIGNVAQEFVKFCQTYVYIPTIPVVIVCIFILAFGNIQEKSSAKKSLIYVFFGIAALMSVTTIISFALTILSPDNGAGLATKK